jgi:uncharacterized protein (DUF1800 family)
VFSLNGCDSLIETSGDDDTTQTTHHNTTTTTDTETNTGTDTDTSTNTTTDTGTDTSTDMNTDNDTSTNTTTDTSTDTETNTGTDTSTDSDTDTGTENTTTLSPKDYIPQDGDLTEAMAVKFLNMSTFGATPELLKEIQTKGVIKWVDDQLAMQYDEKKQSTLRRLISVLTSIDPDYYSTFWGKKRDCGSDIEKWMKNDGVCIFNQSKRNHGDELSESFSKIFDAQMRYKDQLRQRVAYALSQTIVASQSDDQFFRDRGEALSYYYDILQKDAFGNYGDLLYDISMSPTMATFLTYAGNRAEYIDAKTKAKILPDENYGREIMQLFSIGLYELNMDGTQERGSSGKRISTYDQDDVNNMSRVFTGLHYAHAKFTSSVLGGDVTHPLECEQQYHDSETKKILGQTLPGGQTCEQDIKAAIELLINHKNTAPFIAKKLILRLTKSNPTDAYVRRVATVFADTHGDLKETVKAVLLDEEIWEDIKQDKGVKIKEPYLAFTGTLRAMGSHPLKKYKRSDKVTTVDDGYQVRSLYPMFGQWIVNSPSVFNFYSDEFVPDDYEFKIRGFVAPELEIITSKYNVINFNSMSWLLYRHSITYIENSTKKWYRAPDGTILYFVYDDIVDVFKKNGFGDNLDKGSGDAAVMKKVVTAAIDFISKRLMGKVLPDAQRDILIDKYTSTNWWPKRGNNSYVKMKLNIIDKIRKMVLEITHTDSFMVQ